MQIAVLLKVSRKERVSPESDCEKGNPVQGIEDLYIRKKSVLLIRREDT